MAETLLDLTIPVEEETCISNIDVEPASNIEHEDEKRIQYIIDYTGIISIVPGGSGELSKYFCDVLLSIHFRWSLKFDFI